MFATVLTILATLLFGGLLVMIVLISTYNRLAWLRTRWQTAFAQLQVHMRRRYDLIAQLVDVATDSHHLSTQTLEAVADACQTACTAEQRATQHPHDQQAMGQLISAEAQFDSAVSQLQDIVAADEILRNDAQVVALHDELDSTNSRISFAREAYNDFAAHYQAGREQFPASWVANRLGFGQIELLQDSGPLQPAAVQDGEER